MTTQHSCPFCALSSDRIRTEGEHALVIDDGFPISPEHALIAPRRHVASLFKLDERESSEIFTLLARARSCKERRLDGFNIGINDGVAAGQTMMHLHVHLIPRYLGDRPDPRGGVRWNLSGQGRLLVAV